MQVLELFSGTESISKAFRTRGHECITVDNDGENFGPTILYDILDISISDFLKLGEFDMIWASPPCQAFSVEPKYWFIENPRGVLRKLWFMKYLPRTTVTYCQYGDTRMKPTDIWGTVDEIEFRPMCKNGAPCHERAPRGSRTGTQGLKNRIERARIPEEFCMDLCKQLEKLI